MIFTCLKELPINRHYKKPSITEKVTKDLNNYTLYFNETVLPQSRMKHNYLCLPQ